MEESDEKSDERGSKNKVVYPELSYKIVGLLFEVWDEIGWSHKEKYIQKAIALAFNNHGIRFKKEVKTDLKYHGDKIGVYFLDFLVEDKIVLEIKKREFFSQQDIKQIYSYLKATDLKLGIIVHFTSRGIRFKRILNLN
ncbi:MAG: GxxExxY protein [Patescibacteria group bacterium]